LEATDANGATNTKSVTIIPTNEDPLLTVHKNKKIYTQSQRADKPFSFATVDGSLYNLNEPDSFDIDGKQNSTKIDFLVYCGSNATAGFNIWAPGGDEPTSGKTPCSTFSTGEAGALLWKNVYKVPSGCTAGECCEENLWPVRNQTLFNLTDMTRAQFMNATFQQVDSIAAGTSMNTGYIKGANFPKVIGFVTAAGKKGLLLLDSYESSDPSNVKSNRITFSVKVAK
jgi:hypothetical protein